MRNILIAAAILLIPTVLVGQQSNFKNKQKNSSGTHVPAIPFKQINGSNNLKSSSVSPYQSNGVLSVPNIKQKTSAKKIFKNHSPVYFETTNPNLKSANLLSAEERFYSFFERTRKISGLTNPTESMRIKAIQTDSEGIMHIRSVQQHKGIEIYGSESTTHFDIKKERFTGKIFNVDKNTETIPAITVETALNRCTQHLKTQTHIKEFSKTEKELLEYHQPDTKLVLFKNDDNTFRLAWSIAIRPNFIEVWNYFIDAGTGEIIRKFNATNSDGPATATAYDLNNQQRTFNTYLENGSYLMADLSQPMYNATKNEGMIITFDANNTSSENLDYKLITSSNNVWNNPRAVSAHANTIKTYEYLLNTFQRSSMNNQGGNILSFINITNSDGTSMANAYWNGKAAFYGNGGDEFKSLAGAQDVISHELGHGVVSNTANLEYYGQSGAINETYADIFGSMVDRDDWLIGEDVVKTSSFPSGALRSMSDPHNGGNSNNYWWQPKHTSEMYIGEQDNAGVHTNSGIGNYAFYLYATALTKAKAEQTFYRALAYYLTPNSQFIDFRIAVIQSAKDLYGSASNEAAQAAIAFDKVGIYDEAPVEEEQEYEVNNGQEFLLSYNTNQDYSDKLDRTTTSGSDFVLLTKTDMKGKASVTDDGSFAVFVSTDDKIRSLTLDPATISEDIIQDEAFWDNVAVSKDGMRIAAISNEIDASIWVYDYEIGDWSQFQLYNPTTSHDNTDAGGVLYADAIEFDITGEYLIYDAYNELNSSTSDNISYWDIGFIKVWDKATNNFGDGNISKLFGSLPEKVSVGNPVFSKNSPNIIAFDYFDESTDETIFAIVGVDLLTGDLDVIFENWTLGFPSFSADDSKMAFSTISDTDNEVVGAINLATNKISASGEATLLIDYAKWPVYYATGSRTLGLEPVANFTADFKSGTMPLEVQFFDASLNNPTSWSWSFPGGTPSSSILQNPVVTYYTNGSYQVTLNASNSIGNNTSTKANYIDVWLTGNSSLSNNAARMFPNPATNCLNISCSENFSVNLLNVNGQLILKEENNNQIDLSGLSTGFYFVEVRSENQLIREKILKQ